MPLVRSFLVVFDRTRSSIAFIAREAARHLIREVLLLLAVCARHRNTCEITRSHTEDEAGTPVHPICAARTAGRASDLRRSLPRAIISLRGALRAEELPS